MNKFFISALLLLGLAESAVACNTEYNITLQTFGEGVLVELRSGTPGKSRIVQSRKSSGGEVNFANMCPGNYFLAIGNEDSVSVTQTQYFEADAIYTGNIVMQRGSGNVSHKSRKAL
jgi:hypothetical protein